MKKLFIISNESVFNYEGKYFCDNLDIKSTPEGLQNNFEIDYIQYSLQNNFEIVVTKKKTIYPIKGLTS